MSKRWRNPPSIGDGLPIPMMTGQKEDTMGYESRLFVVRKFGTGYAEVMGMIDMCKVYPMSDVMRRYPATECYIYTSDGQNKIEEDMYGEKLREIPLDEAIMIVERAQNIDPDYVRYEICLNVLRAFQKYSDNLVVLHFGY